jgi:carboxyl-terminal processing protease
MLARRAARWLAALAAALALLACGGGGSAPAGSASCDLASQQDWLRSYMLDWYYWSGTSPNPAPSGFTTLQTYFDALKFTNYPGRGTDPWSYYQDSASYNQFFSEGQTLGYGLFVNGTERQLPLRVRMTEPKSPAGLAGLVRGDTIVSVNGVAAADLITGDFAVLNPAKTGDSITVVVDTATGRGTFVLTAAVYTLTPVPVAEVLSLPNGTKAGYVMLKDFITQAEQPLIDALAAFRAQGATELIVDLRYNGGGRISTATKLASLIAGAAHAGQTFAELHYNAAHTSSDTRYVLATDSGAAFARVLVLTGSRTCSASELIVNGLAPLVNVVTLGGTTCGKPYGFNPVASCGNTFSVVNFHSVNAAGTGDYELGLAPVCPVAEDFTGVLGDPAEKLTAAASSYLQTGSCPVAAAPGTAAPATASRQAQSRSAVEPGDRRGMIAD